MLQTWWQLPGPFRFVDKIATDLQEGRNVVICLPEHPPSGLSRAVRSRLPETDNWPWHTLDVSDEASLTPIDLLYSQFVPYGRPEELRNASTLSQQPTFEGRIIWLEGLSPPSWAKWKSFLSEYGHACRSVSLLKRTVFCVTLIGEVALDPPPEDVCVACHHWRGVVGTFDALLHAIQVFEESDMPQLQRRVAINVASSLAEWDPSVTERLADEDITNILSPFGVLKSLAAERGWEDQGPSDETKAWAAGMLNLFEGEKRRHSACLTFEPEQRGIERRIWSAEVVVMLPFVEEQRQMIISRISPGLQMPFYTKTGEVISDYRELEIGHIYSLASNNTLRIDPGLKKLIGTLREIRNALAHLGTLSPEIFRREEITQIPIPR